MSHPLYNPYASGNQCSTQGQYGQNTVQPERDPRRASRPVLGSSFNTSGGSSSASTKTPGKIPPLMSQQVSYRPEQSRDDDIQRSVDFHVSRAREEVMFLDKPTHQSLNQGNRFANTQRDEFLPSSTRMTNFSMSSISATLQQRQADTETASSSMDWLSSYKKPAAEDSSNFYSSSASSSYVSSNDSRFNPSSERDSNTQSIPGLSNFDYPNRPVTTETGQPKYTSESAANILLHFGLEKEDLEHLISYPEDQITPSNLPFILRQIRIQKTKRTPSAAQSKPYSESQPSRKMSEIDSISSASMAMRRQEEISSAVLQPSKVIDYRHTGKYTGTGDEIGMGTGSRSDSSGSGNTLLLDSFDSTHSRESLKKNPTDVRSTALDSSRDKRSSITNLLSSFRTEPDTRELSALVSKSNDPTIRLQNQQTKQSSQIIQSSFSLPKKDTDIRVHKTEVSRTLPSKDSKVGSQASSKTSTFNTLFRDVHPSRPGLVVIDSRGSTTTKIHNKTTGQGSTTAEHIKQQQQQQPSQIPALWPPVFSAAKPAPVRPVSLNTTGLNVSHAMVRPVFVPGSPIVIPSTTPQGIPSLYTRPPMILPSRQPTAAAVVSKGLPSTTMMHDYAAASPKIFPHTCSLCNKECGTMKDWISHQNTSLHLESCKVLRARYPEWDGEIALRPSAAGKDANPVPTTSPSVSQHRHQKTRRGRSSCSRSRSRSRSHSSSPRGRHDTRRDRRSRSRSPRSSRYSHRSRSRSPRYNRQTSGRHRSRSRSHERRSPPRRRDEKRSSPRSEDRRSSPRNRERRSPHRRGDTKRSSPRRSRERRSSTERSSPQRASSSSAERLAKKLLEKTAAQSLSKPSELEAVVKSLAPALLAELAKMRSSATSSTSSPVSKGEKSSRSSLSLKDKSSSSAASSTASVATAKKVSATSYKAKASLQKTKSSASTKTKAKPSPPTMVKLQGVRSSLSHSDVVTSVEQFGKTKSVVLFRSKVEAIVCFEKEEDAKKLKSIKMFDIKGMSVSVVNEKVTESKVENMTPQKNPALKPASANVSTHQATKSTAAAAAKPKTKKAVVSKPGKTQHSSAGKSSTVSSGTKNTTTTNLSKEKGVVKGSSNVCKAKALLSKAKNASSDQKAKADKPVPGIKASKLSKTGTTPAKTGTKLKAKGSTVKDTKVPPNKTSEKVVFNETSQNQNTKKISIQASENEDTKVTSNEASENVTSNESSESQKETKGTSNESSESQKETKVTSNEALESQETKVTSNEALESQETKVTSNEASKTQETKVTSNEASKTQETKVTSNEASESRETNVTSNEASESRETNVTSNEASESRETKVTSNEASESQKETKVTSNEASESQKETKVTSNEALESQETNVTYNEASEKVTSNEPAEYQETQTYIHNDSKTKLKKSVVVLEKIMLVKIGDVKVNVSGPQPHPLKVEVKEKAEPMEVVTTEEISSEVAQPMDFEACVGDVGEKLTNMEDLPRKCSESLSPLSIAETTADASQLKQPTVSPENTAATPKPADTCTLVGASSQIQQSILTEPESSAQSLQASTHDAQTHSGSSPEAALESNITVELEKKMTRKDHDAIVKNQSDYTSSKEATTAIRNVSAASTEDATSDQTKSTAELQSNQQASTAVESKKQATATTGSPTAVESKKQMATAVSSSSNIGPVTIPELVNLHERNFPCFKRQTCFKKEFPTRECTLLLITNLPKYDGCYTEEDIAQLLIPSGFIYKDETIHVIPQACMAFALMPAAVNVQHILKRCSALSQITFKNTQVKVSVVSYKTERSHLGFYKFLMNRMKLPVASGVRVICIKNISEIEARDLKETLKKIDGVTNYFPLLNKVYIEFWSIFDADRLGVWYSLLKQAPKHHICRLMVPHSPTYPPPPKLPNKAVPDSKHVLVVARSKSCIPGGTIAPFWVTLPSSPFVFPTSSPWFNIPNFMTVKSLGDIQKAKSRGASIHTVMLTGLPEGNYKHEDVAKMVWPYFRRQDMRDLYYNVIVLPLQKRAFVQFQNWKACCDFVQDHIHTRPRIRGTSVIIHFVLKPMHLKLDEELMYENLMKWSNARVPDVESLEERLLCVEISETSVDIVKLVLEAVSSIAPFVSFLPLANRICVEMADPSGVTQVLEKCHAFKTTSFQQNFIWCKVVRFEHVRSLKQHLMDSLDIPINLNTDTISVESKPPAVTCQQQPSPPRPSYSGLAVSESGTAASATATSKCEEVPQTTTAAPAKGATADLPVIDDNTFRLIRAAVRERRLTRETTTQNLNKESKSNKSSKGLNDEQEKKGQVDFTDDDVSSQAYFFHELRGNMEDFVTVDEVGDDMESTSPDHYSSSSEEMSERQSATQVSTDSSKDSKSSASSPSPSSSLSKMDKGSMKSPSSILTSASKDSCGPTTKPSPPPSASVSNTSVSCLLSAESPSSHDQKQQDKTKSLGEVSTEIVEASVTTASQGEKGTEAKSDHCVSPKDSAAKTVESETKIELPPEMHPCAHSPSLQKDDIMKEKTNDEKKEHSIDEYAKEEVDDNENYHILDSLDEQMDDGDQESKLATCLPESDEAQSLVSEIFQVLDSVDDEAKVCPQEESEVEMSSSFKVLDSITEEQAAASQDDSLLVKDETLSEEDATKVLSVSEEKCSTEDTSSNCQEVKDSSSQMLDTGSNQVLRVKEAARNQETEEQLQSKMLSGQSSKHMESVDCVQNEDWSIENCDLFSDANEQETFEVLDSIDDQLEIEDDDKKTKTPSDLTHEEDVRPVTTETDSETDKETSSKKGEATTSKGSRHSKRSSTRSRTVKSEDSRTKTDTTEGTSPTGNEISEEMVFEIVDSVEDEPAQNVVTTERSGRRRTARGKREDGSKDTPYKIVYSVDDATANDETTITTRSTRGRRDKTVTDLLSDKSKMEETPARRRHTPARDSQEKATTKENASKESTPTKKRDNVKEVSKGAATYEILDYVEEENVKSDQPATKGKRKRGRPKKESVTLKTNKDASDKVAEEEVIYQILDSVEDEVVDEPPKCSSTTSMQNEDQPTKSPSHSGPSKTEEEEEEPVYEIVDSLEEDQVQEEPVATVVEATKHGDLSEIGEDVRNPDNKGQESDNKCDTLSSTSNLGALDEVSEDEEDYPDDTAEKEELRRRQAATKSKHLANEQKKGQERKTRGRGERERRSSRGGGLDDEAVRGAKEKGKKQEKELEVDPKELLTLDEVGADEGGEETPQEGPEWDGDIPEAELQALVTLDEIVEEEDEEEKVEPSTAEAHSSSNEERAAENLHLETLETLDEEKVDENQAETTSAKRKHEDTEENINYVTVDEVGENEEVAEKEAATTRPRGRPRKRARQTPVRKSIRGRNINAKNEEHKEKESSGNNVLSPTSLDSSSSPSVLSNTQTDVQAACTGDTSAGQKPQPENQGHDECVEQGEEEKEGCSRASVKVASKRRKELVGPEAKRSRSQSPCVAADFKLPPFDPSSPLGQEFVIPKSGYYCNLCSVFYLNESSAKDLHCSSQRHYDSLQNYYQKLKQKPSSSTQKSQGFISE